MASYVMNILIDRIRAYLINNVNDPCKSRRQMGWEWIVGKFPSIHPEEQPTIGVYSNSTDFEELGLSLVSRYKDILHLRIALFCDQDGIYTIHNDTQEGWAFIQALYEVVRPLLEDADTQFNTWGWTRAIPRSLNNYEEQGIIGYVLDYDIRRWNLA